MSAGDIPWKILGYLVVLLGAGVPIYAAYDIYGRGPSPEKHVELWQQPPIDPLRDLSALGDKVTLSLKMRDDVIDNVVVVQATLRNVGTAPIVPSDYHGNLSVMVSAPWKILAVENQPYFSLQLVRLLWNRVSDTRFEAEPTLLNPGDVVSTAVYLTFTRDAVLETAATDNPSDPGIKWDARITNLRAFSKPQDPVERMRDRMLLLGMLFEVQLLGWAVMFTILAALLFQAGHLHLLSLTGYLRDWSAYSIGLVLCTSLLSFAAAESSATYLFGNTLTDIVGVNHWLNMPPILINALVFVYLYTKSRAGTGAVST